MKSLCIAVHDQMLAAALSVPVVGRILSAHESMRIRQNQYQAGGIIYPSWYLFGCREKNVEGLLSHYKNLCDDVYLCPQSHLTPDLQADFIDVQFCSLSDNMLEMFQRQGRIISGYLPECYSSKSVQAKLLKDAGGGRFVPTQQTYTNSSSPLLPDSAEQLWIIKSPSGSAGRGENGMPYSVWRHETLAANLEKIISALGSGEELIISEFIITADPYADFADHVVHKMHYVGGTERFDDSVVPYGSGCQKHVYRCNWQALHNRGALPLSDFIGKPEFTVGNIETIDGMDNFSKCMGFHSGRVLISVDFIVPSDGIPRYLESNKLAATYAEQFDQNLPAPIDYYGSLPVEIN
ncbi:MAG: hypothetical protein SCK29_07275 [Bacillota bacterium]|nr:hypothetical protein [Bacillota bacterium]MDW7683900.1 hypothetical protein [Bacillota bacterium]